MKPRSYKNMAYGKFLKNISFVLKLSDFTPVYAWPKSTLRFCWNSPGCIATTSDLLVFFFIRLYLDKEKIWLLLNKLPSQILKKR